MTFEESHSSRPDRIWSLDSYRLEETDDDFCLWHKEMSAAGILELSCCGLNRVCFLSQLDGAAERDLRDIQLTDFCSYGDLIDSFGSSLWGFFRYDVEMIRDVLNHLEQTARQKPKLGNMFGAFGSRSIDQVHLDVLLAGVKNSKKVCLLLCRLVAEFNPVTEEELMLTCIIVNNYWLAAQGKHLTEEIMDGPDRPTISILSKLLDEANANQSVIVTRNQNLVLKSLNQLRRCQAARLRKENKARARKVS